MLEGRAEGLELTELLFVMAVRLYSCGAVMLATFMLYGCRLGEAWSAGEGCWLVCTDARRCAFGVLTSLQGPNLASVRESTVAASSGSSTFQRFASTLRIPSVRRAHSHPSAISSRCLTPWMMSRFAFFSGRLRRCIVHAECAIYTQILHICRRPCDRLYNRSSLEIMAAAWVQSFRGETWAGSGELFGLYFRNGRKRWM